MTDDEKMVMINDLMNDREEAHINAEKRRIDIEKLNDETIKAYKELEKAEKQHANRHGELTTLRQEKDEAEKELKKRENYQALVGKNASSTVALRLTEANDAWVALIVEEAGLVGGDGAHGEWRQRVRM